MSDNKVTLDQLDNSAVEAMSSSVGDVNMLNTENKTIVGALAEIVGKKEIANAIGEPLAKTDKFTEMSSEINGLLSTFKTNMMNAGVVVESGDKFKALIDKIKGLTEGEGNKGIQFAEGNVADISIMYSSSATKKTLNYDIDFIPSLLFLFVNEASDGGAYRVYRICLNNITTSPSQWYAPNLGQNVFLTLNNVNNNSFDLTVQFGGYTSGGIILSGIKYYAIGVGEEDTTLRDSLASILENKGVDVTEEDDMASLITKVDSINVGYSFVAGNELTLYNLSIGEDNPYRCEMTNRETFYYGNFEYNHLLCDGTFTVHMGMTLISASSVDIIWGYKIFDIDGVTELKSVEVETVTVSLFQILNGSVNCTTDIDLKEGYKIKLYCYPKGTGSLENASCSINDFSVTCDIVK